MKRLGFYAALSLTLSAPSAVTLAAGSPFAGVFGNVVYNQKIDDLRGAEIEIRGGGASASGEFIDCQGMCLDINKVDVKLSGNTIAFEYAQPPASAEGTPTVRKYTGTLKGDKLTLREVGVPGAKPQVLVRRPERYALDIAVEASTDHGH